MFRCDQLFDKLFVQFSTPMSHFGHLVIEFGLPLLTLAVDIVRDYFV